MSARTRDEIRQAILATSHPVPKSIDAGPWGMIYLKTLTVGEVMNFKADTADPENKKAVARGLARVIVTQDGEPVFDPENAEDIAAIAGLPWPIVNKVLTASDETNALAADKDQIEKN